LATTRYPCPNTTKAWIVKTPHEPLTSVSPRGRWGAV